MLARRRRRKSLVGRKRRAFMSTGNNIRSREREKTSSVLRGDRVFGKRFTAGDHSAGNKGGLYQVISRSEIACFSAINLEQHFLDFLPRTAVRVSIDQHLFFAQFSSPPPPRKKGGKRRYPLSCNRHLLLLRRNLRLMFPRHEKGARNSRPGRCRGSPGGSKGVMTNPY